MDDAYLDFIALLSLYFTNTVRQLHLNLVLGHFHHMTKILYAPLVNLLFHNTPCMH